MSLATTFGVIVMRQLAHRASVLAVNLPQTCGPRSLGSTQPQSQPCPPPTAGQLGAGSVGTGSGTLPAIHGARASTVSPDSATALGCCHWLPNIPGRYPRWSYLGASVLKRIPGDRCWCLWAPGSSAVSEPVDATADTLQALPPRSQETVMSRGVRPTHVPAFAPPLTAGSFWQTVVFT